jgi:hypothetical protein
VEYNTANSVFRPPLVASPEVTLSFPCAHQITRIAHTLMI